MDIQKSSTKKSIKCKDCYCTLPAGSETVNCKICKQPICLRCSNHSKTRANGQNSGFYKQYINTCDSCIWFDIG